MNDQNLTRKERRALERQEYDLKEKREKRNRLIGRIFLWTLVAVIIGGSIWGLMQLGARSINSTTPGQADAPLAEPVTAADWAHGNPAAKVTLVEYSDLQCPACAGAYPVLKQLKNRFPNDLRIVYRHFPLPIHAYADEAAQFAEAAGRQGKFWEMHDLLFERQADWSRASNPEKLFVEYGRVLGLDTGKLEEDANSKEAKDAVNEDMAGGNRSRVDSTPTFFLNGKRIYIQSFADLFTIVEAAIKE